jgi:purine/pyrimidine-nucleoside phosphorylase
MSHPAEFPQVTALTRGNIYYDGGVVSHSLRFEDGSRKTLGVIKAGSYHFDTGAPERMDITEGNVRFRLAGSEVWISCRAGESFEVPGNSRFDIVVDEGFAQYVCSFLA